MLCELWVLFVFQTLLHLSEGNVIVKTKNGLLQGLEATTIGQGKPYYSFRGIPYGKPPVGDLRFKAPEPYESWDGIRPAISEGNICVQRYDLGSEDCLFINVYTPKNMSEKSSLLPVMVWIYGGVFLYGDSTYAMYGPDYFLDEDVVFVSFNYRLGVFGFLSTEDEAAYGNWGLKDQLLALRWVQDNIEYFGGDRNRVTVFGESAGSASISYLMQSSLAEGLFHGAIMQSGSSLNLWGLTRKPRSVSFALGGVLGIKTNNTTELTDKLRQVDAGKLWWASMVVSAGGTLATVSLSGLMFAPSREPEHDGAVVLGRSHENLKTGFFNKVPVIIGFNSQEGLMIYGILDIVMDYVITLDLIPNDLIPVDLNLADQDLVANVSNAISTKYFGEYYEYLNKENLTQYITDDQFVRPINEAARLMSKWVPTYHYRFSFNESGVTHAEELPYMFVSSKRLDSLIRQRILKLWTNFAKTSTPMPDPDSFFDDVVWKSYSEEGTFLDFGSVLSMSSNIEKYNIQWWKSIFDEYGNPPFDTY